MLNNIRGCCVVQEVPLGSLWCMLLCLLSNSLLVLRSILAKNTKVNSMHTLSSSIVHLYLIYQYIVYASACAGSLMLGSFKRSWIPSKIYRRFVGVSGHHNHKHLLHNYCIGFTCFMVTAGLQSLSSSSSDRQTVPDGYTLGWNIGGSNLPAYKETKLVNPP